MDVTAERADIDKKVSGKTVCTIFADAVRNWPDRTGRKRGIRRRARKPAVSRPFRIDRGETAVYPALAPSDCSKF